MVINKFRLDVIKFLVVGWVCLYYLYISIFVMMMTLRLCWWWRVFSFRILTRYARPSANARNTGTKPRRIFFSSIWVRSTGKRLLEIRLASWLLVVTGKSCFLVIASHRDVSLDFSPLVLIMTCPKKIKINIRLIRWQITITDTDAKVIYNFIDTKLLEERRTKLSSG